MELPIWCVIEPKTPYKPKVKVPRCTIPFCGNHAGSGGNSRKYYIATPKQINYFKVQFYNWTINVRAKI